MRVFAGALVMSTKSKRKQKRSDIELRIETKPKRFDVFQNLKWNVSIYSKNFGTKPKLFDVFHLFFSRSKTFIFIPKILEQNQNFLMCSNFFLAKAKSYYLIQKLRNRTKTFGFSSQISKRKTELFVVSRKNFETEQTNCFWTKNFEI